MADREAAALATLDPPDWLRCGPHSLQILVPERIAQAVAVQLVALLRAVLAQASHAVVVPSAGRTLLQTFRVLREVHRKSVEWNRVVCVQMDEYAGIGRTDDGSFAALIFRQFVEPLAIGRFVSFYDSDGRESCTLDEYERQLRALGGIDCAVHGVGRNGHIGFNEPAETTQWGSRSVPLAQSTRESNGVAHTHGVTLGLGILGEARCSIVVMQGIEKRQAAAALLFGAVGAANPVAHLRGCRRLYVYLDPAAVPERHG